MKYIYQNKQIKLVINQDLVGFYLIVYENPSSLTSTSDYLLDTLEEAFQEAQDRFGVLASQWKQSSQ